VSYTKARPSSQPQPASFSQPAHLKHKNITEQNGQFSQPIPARELHEGAPLHCRTRRVHLHGLMRLRWLGACSGVYIVCLDLGASSWAFWRANPSAPLRVFVFLRARARDFACSRAPSCVFGRLRFTHSQAFARLHTPSLAWSAFKRLRSLTVMTSTQLHWLSLANSRTPSRGFLSLR
jgi:hypothetical protein